jgi:hypothetical protein
LKPCIDPDTTLAIEPSFVSVLAEQTVDPYPATRRPGSVMSNPVCGDFTFSPAVWTAKSIPGRSP